MNAQRRILALMIGLMLISLTSCRPRATRSRVPQKPAAQSTAPKTTPSGPSAKEVLARTDDAMKKIQAMDSEPELPPVASEPQYDLPRSVTGNSAIPKPDMSSYGTFEAGLAAFNGAHYDEAIGLFSQVLTSGKPPELVPNAYYWMGESFYAMQRYAESLSYFEYVTKVGPQYKREISFYKLSRANLKLGNKQAAGLWYERLKSDYPKSTYASKLAKLGVR